MKPAQLIRRYCTGDDDAFRLFFDAQAPKLWRYLIARGVDAEDAYDLVSEAFTRFVGCVCRDPASPVALLYRIALNLNVDRVRRAATARDYRNGMPPTGDPPSPDNLHLVRQLLGRIDADEQNMLLMRYWVGMTHREIAQVTGVPEGTVRRKVAALLGRLRVELEPEPR